MFDPARIEEYKAEAVDRAYRWLDKDIRDAFFFRETAGIQFQITSISFDISVVLTCGDTGPDFFERIYPNAL
jgi:hypothetical protein